MIGIDLHGLEATQLPAAKITAAVLTLATGNCLITYTDVNSVSRKANVGGPDGVDLYNALVAIKAGTYTTA